MKSADSTLTSVDDDILDMDTIDLSPIRTTMASRPKPKLPVILQFKNLSYSIKQEGGGRRKLLDNISGIARPGELTIIMGPTGSGKTTLLSCLSRRIKKDVTGELTVNGQPPTGDYKRQVAFVLQDDVLFPGLTVEQTLYYTALLRVPGTLDHQKQKVAETIEALGLTKAKETLIGGQYFRGVSGGERKRVNIGNEILTDPSLILLDEPTSGLDTSTALSLLQMLKGMAESGLTIVATIHQPSSQMWSLFDNLLLLVEGQPIYWGKANGAVGYLASKGLKCEQYWNPADFIMGLILREEVGKKGGASMKEVLVNNWKNHLEISGTKDASMATKQDEDLIAEYRMQQVSLGTPTYARSFFGQIWILLQRSWILSIFKFFDIFLWAQTFILAFLVGIVWFQTPYTTDFFSERAALIFFIFNYIAGFLPAFDALFAFPTDRAVVVRERKSGSYRLSSYYIAKLLIEIPWYFPTAIVFIVISYFMGGLNYNAACFFIFFFINILAIFTSASLGILISAITLPNTQAAMTTLTVIIMLFYVLGGFFIQTYPSWMIWIPYLSFFKYTYNALLVNEFYNTPFYIVDNGTVTNETISGTELVQPLLIGFPDEIYANALILLLMGLVFRILGFFALSWSIRRAPQ